MTDIWSDRADRYRQSAIHAEGEDLELVVAHGTTEDRFAEADVVGVAVKLEVCAPGVATNNSQTGTIGEVQVPRASR